MMNWVLVGLGGALGSIARYAVGLALASGSIRFPLATLVVNVIGSMAIGYVHSLSARSGINPAATLFFTTGVLGGFTTFSAFSLQTMLLMQQNDWARALLNVALSLALCLAGVWIGLALGAKQ